MNCSRPLRVTVVLVGIALGVAIAEIVLGLVGRKHTFLAYSESRGWRLRPGAEGWYAREGRAWVSINADGLRGPPVTPAKPAGTWRVAVPGDSFVEAIHVPYEQTFPAVLERELQAGCIGRTPRPGVELRRQRLRDRPAAPDAPRAGLPTSSTPSAGSRRSGPGNASMSSRWRR